MCRRVSILTGSFNPSPEQWAVQRRRNPSKFPQSPLTFNLPSEDDA